MKIKIEKRDIVWCCRFIVKMAYTGIAVLMLRELACYGRLLNASGHPEWGHVLSAVAVLGCGWILIILLHKVMQHSLALIISFLALFTYGVYIYNVSGVAFDEWWPSVLLPMNSTLSIFFPSRGGYDNVGFYDVSLHYTLLHLFSYLYIAMLGISLFGRKVMNRSMRRFIHPLCRNIFWGYSDGGVLLAKDMREKRYIDKALFILPQNMPLSIEVERYRFEEIDGIGGIILYKDLSRRVKRPRGARHFFLTEDQDLNVKLAFMVLESLRKREENLYNRTLTKIFGKRAVPRIFKRWYVTKLYVRTELAHVDSYFTKVLESLKGVAEVQTINESELTARRFIEENPPLEMPGVAEKINVKTGEVNFDFKILQLGYGWSGKAVLNKLICNTQFEGSTLSATIFDRDLKTLHGFYPLLDNECFSKMRGDVNYYDIDFKTDYIIGSERFKQWVVDHIKEYNRVIVALGDDAFNVHIALSIANILNSDGVSYADSSKLIFAHIRNADCCTYFKLDATPISVFGNKDLIYTMNIIIKDELDEIAKELNYYYNFKRDDYMAQRVNRRYRRAKSKMWHAAGILDQESSRAAAVAINNTLRLCGLIMSRDKRAEAVESSELNATLDNELLYINEHNRWNAFHFTRGVKRWELSEATEEIFAGAKPKPNRIKERNRHAALVSYNDLEKVDAHFNPLIEKYNQYNEANNTPNFKQADKSNLKENDMKFVRDIATVLERVGYKIVEIKNDKKNEV